MEFNRKLKYVLSDKRSTKIAMVISLSYIILFLFSIGDIRLSSSSNLLSIQVVDNWLEKVFKPVAPFLWEQIAVIHLVGGWAYLLSIPNLMVALILGVFVHLNIALAVFSYKVTPLKVSLRGVIGLIPSFLAGLTCCVPTFIFAFGAISTSLTVFFIQLRQYLIPFSSLILTINLFYGFRNLHMSTIKGYQKSQFESA
jgi:hypothetical protein